MNELPLIVPDSIVPPNVFASLKAVAKKRKDKEDEYALEMHQNCMNIST